MVELATTMGHPSEIVARDLIKFRFDLGDGSDFDSSSTWAYSILHREGITSTANIEILTNSSSTTKRHLLGIDITTQIKEFLYYAIVSFLKTNGQFVDFSTHYLNLSLCKDTELVSKGQFSIKARLELLGNPKRSITPQLRSST